MSAIQRLVFAGAVAVVTVLSGCASGGPPTPSEDSQVPAYPGLDAALWTQTSAEAYLLRVSAYAAATEAMERGVADPSRSAL